MDHPPVRSAEKLGISYEGDAGFFGPPITVYTRTVCRSCKRVVSLLSGAGLDFEVVNLDEPIYADARTFVTEVLGARSVPVVVTADYPPIIGYEPTKVKALIAALSLTLNEGDDDGPD